VGEDSGHFEAERNSPLLEGGIVDVCKNYSKLIGAAFQSKYRDIIWA